VRRLMTARKSLLGPFRSGQLAELAGVSTDTLRHYERTGVLPRPERAPNGYREYPTEALERVRLVRRALAIGFTLEELARILAIRDRGLAPCRYVRALAGEKLHAVEDHIQELEVLRETLRGLIKEWDARLAVTPEGTQARLLTELLPPTAPEVFEEARPPVARRGSRQSAPAVTPRRTRSGRPTGGG
jgi:MerR family transcriptional regulator, copper efflux regulator